MTPPRLADWLLRTAIRDRDVADSIRGDLYDEYRARSRAWRGVWYTWHALLKVRVMRLPDHPFRASTSPPRLDGAWPG
jgi:hypothetical protein